MFTVEHHFDHTLVTSLDERDEFEDIQVILTEDVVYILQYDEIMQETMSVFLSYQQLKDILASINRPEGAYYIED